MSQHDTLATKRELLASLEAEIAAGGPARIRAARRAVVVRRAIKRMMDETREGE